MQSSSLTEHLWVQIVTVDEAKTFYPLFGLGANVALIFSGRAVKYFSQVRSLLSCERPCIAEVHQHSCGPPAAGFEGRLHAVQRCPVAYCALRCGVQPSSGVAL